MPLYDDPTMYDDLTAQSDALTRRKAIIQAQALAAANQTGRFAMPTPDNSEVGGYTLSTGQRMPGRVLKTPTGALLNPLAATIGQQFAENRFDTDQAQFNQRAKADALQRLNNAPQSTPAIPGHLDYTTGSDTPSAMTSGAPAVEPSLRDRLEFAFGLKSNPLTSSLGDAYASDSLVKQPEREEARAERATTRQEKIAEERRKQKQDIEFKTWSQNQSDQTRRDIAELVHGAGGGGRSRGGGSSSPAIALTDENGQPVEGWKRAGVKANDIVKDVDSSGNVTLTDKLTGQRLTVGGGGRASAGNDKDALESRNAIERSTSAIGEAARAKVLLSQGSSSGLRADIRKAGNYVAPSLFGGKALEADEALKPIADIYLKSVPRFEGPQSDKDTASYMKAAGQLANTNLSPPIRAAALDEVVRLHQKSIDQLRGRAPTPTAPARPPGAPPTVRESVNQAVRQQQGGWSVEPVR